MSHGKRKQLPTSDPEYILSLLEGDSSGESDSDLYSESDDEDSFFSEASPTSSFQSYSSISHSPSISSGQRNLSFPSISPPTSSFRATTFEHLQQKALCRPLPPLFRFPHSHYRPCLLLFVLLNESLTLLFLLNFTPTPLPSLVLLLPLHYHHHCVVSVRAAATLELLMV